MEATRPCAVRGPVRDWLGRVEQVFIRASVRGRGMGSEALGALLGELRASGLKALHLDIPPGHTRSYGDIARQLGTSARAVGNACRANPLLLLIPCHRVIAASGTLHRYRWGSARKKALIGWEAAKRA